MPRLNLTGVCMHINTSNIADGDPMWMWRYIQEQECMVTMTHTAKISGRKLNLLDCNQNWIKFIYKLIQKTDPKLIKNKNMDMYTRMIMLDLKLVVFIYVWIFFFTLFNCSPKISHISVSVRSTWKLSNLPLPCRYPFRFMKWDLTSIELLHLVQWIGFL